MGSRIYWTTALTCLTLLAGFKPAVALDKEEHWQQTLQRAYQQSVQDAAITDPGEIAPLQPIVMENKTLQWQDINGEPHLRLVTWTNWDGYDDLVGENTVLSREIWTTPAPQVQTFVAQTTPDPEILSLRLEQFLGLPPNNGKTKWVEMWVKPADIFRPCPDAEIIDTECSLYFPADATEEHKAWIVNLHLSSYGDRGYPWTRLGYTYDWGAVGTEVGANELVVRAGAEVIIEQVQTNAEYFGVAAE